VLVLSGGLLLLAAFVAGMMPAFRAVRVDPVLACHRI
jgi:ABC-type antimicrobial peptide transport system permease subunit